MLMDRTHRIHSSCESRSQMTKPIMGLVVALALMISMYPISAVSQGTPNGSFFSKKIYADYNGEFRESTPRDDGLYHIDTPRLIKKLKEGAINTHLFLIWDIKTNWDDFRLEFLPAAQKAKIDVWLFLTPPTENNPPPMGEKYEPYGDDYITWFVETAKLSKKYSVLKAIVIDDFENNEDFFTPEYLKQMMDAVHSINPNLAFLPVNYDLSLSPSTPQSLISTAFVNKYKDSIDGIVFPYLHWQNKDSLDDEESQILMNSDILNGKIEQFTVNFPPNTPSNSGDYSAIAKTVKLSYTSKKPYHFKFRVSDNYDGPINGYHKLQVLIDNKIIWNEDAGGVPSVRYVDLNLQPYIKNKKKFTITARVFEEKGVSNWDITVNWDLPAGHWTFNERGALQGTGIYYPAVKNFKIPLFLAIYDYGYGGIWVPPSDYVYNANIIAHQYIMNNKIKGVIQLNLDKRENSTQFEIIKKLYKKWQNIFGNNSMEVFLDNEEADDIDFQE